MREIVFATNNEHKLQELREIVGHKFNILSLAQIGCHDDIPETASTIEGNAEMKARYVKQHYGYDCFSDDTGLEIDALRIVAEGVNKLRTPESSCIVITHYERLLDIIKPDIVHVLYKGRIVKTAGPELSGEIEQRGYDWITSSL